MTKRAMGYLWTNRKVVILTFELFWIAVFLLASATGQGGGAGINQFVYVNF
jgi:hypothetical protein